MPTDILQPKCKIHALRRFAERYFPAHIDEIPPEDRLFLARIMYECNKYKSNKNLLEKYESQTVEIKNLPHSIKEFFLSAYTSNVIDDPCLKRTLEEKQRKSNHNNQCWHFFTSYKSYVVLFIKSQYKDEIIATTVYEK